MSKKKLEECIIGEATDIKELFSSKEYKDYMKNAWRDSIKQRFDAEQKAMNTLITD